MRIILMVVVGVVLSFSAFAQKRDCDGGNEGHWRFVTCTWGMQECAYSCPSGGPRKVEEDPNKCSDEFLKLACYCWEESEGGDE